MVVPCSLPSIAMVMLWPSGATVILATLITLPSRLSVSWMAWEPGFFSETLVVPGSPL